MLEQPSKLSFWLTVDQSIDGCLRYSLSQSGQAIAGIIAVKAFGSNYSFVSKTGHVETCSLLAAIVAVGSSAKIATEQIP